MTGPLVLGLDVSLTSTGMATHVTHTSIKTKAKDGDGRLAMIHTVVNLALDVNPDLAVIEDLPTHAMSAGKTGMAQGVVRLALVQRGIPYLTVPAASLKKFATNNGRADKGEMHLHLQAAHQDLTTFDYDIKRDDEVDARWLAEVGQHYLGAPTFDIPSDRVERVLETLKEHNFHD